MTIKGRILLADDCITVRKVVRIRLLDGDYELVTVDDIREIPAKAREFGPDLILARATLQGRDGRTVCEALKADPELGSTMVWLIASPGEGWDDERARRSGAAGCLLKPFASNDLIAWLDEVLRKTRPPAGTGGKPQDSSKERKRGGPNPVAAV